MRGNEKTLKLIMNAYTLLQEKICVDDQVAIQEALNSLEQEEIAWQFLPPEQFPNGRRVLTQTSGHYSEDSEIVLDDAIALFHANCCIGLEKKYHFLRRVQEQFLKNQSFNEYFEPKIGIGSPIQDTFDVETLPCFRTKQYCMGPYKKIIVFSAPRTGSSLAYNIFRFLFEDESKIFSHHNDFNQNRLVLKTHKFTELARVEEKDVLYIFTIRNPLRRQHFQL